MANNTNLIGEKIRGEFNCDKCGKLLSPLIMLIANIGNVCSACYSLKVKPIGNGKESSGILITKDGKTKLFIRNTTLETIMESVRARCMNRREGCSFLSDLAALRSHESRCEYRQISCVLRGCQWSGIKKRYVHHLLRPEHKSNLKFSQSETPEDLTSFPLKGISTESDFNNGTFLQKESEDIVILKTISGLCLFGYKVDENGMKMKCAVCRIEKECEELEEESINIEFVSGNVASSYKCKTIDQIEEFKNFNEDEECDIEFNFLHEFYDFSVRLRHNVIGQIIRGLSLKLYSSFAEEVKAKKVKRVSRVECYNAENGCYIFPLNSYEHFLCCKYKNCKPPE